MALTYTCEDQVIEMALEKLKESGLVARDAYFNFEAPDHLRREVAYRDFDFLSRLSRIGEVETVRSILMWLKQHRIVPEDADYDEKAFDELRQEVKRQFTIPGTSVTPVMERLLYMLSSVRRPRRVIGLGTYCGSAHWYGSLVRVVGRGGCTQRRRCTRSTLIRRRRRMPATTWAS